MRRSSGYSPGSSLDTPLPSFTIMGVFWGSVGHLVATHVSNRAAEAYGGG